MGTAVSSQQMSDGGQNYEFVHPCSISTSNFEDFKENTDDFVPQHDVDENQV